MVVGFTKSELLVNPSAIMVGQIALRVCGQILHTYLATYTNCTDVCQIVFFFRSLFCHFQNALLSLFSVSIYYKISTSFQDTAALFSACSICGLANVIYI